MDNSVIHTLDLRFMDEESAIAAYLIPSKEGLILIETGPETSFNHLKEAIKKEGYDWRDVKYVLLTHIHFDHAGATWKFAENKAKIFVHPIGLPHLKDPDRLWNSAKQIYQEQMETLWGEMRGIDKNLLFPIADKETIKIGGFTFTALYTPGHAIHHNSYQLEDVIFTGDVAGVKINNGPVVPPCPPPDIHIENWLDSIQYLRSKRPTILYPTHFGAVRNPGKHLSELEVVIDDWAKWIKPYYDKGISPKEITPKFVEYTNQQLLENGATKEDVEHYAKANPSWMSVGGLLRYWKLKEQGRI